MSKVNKIAILTSGGDAPGMNAAIRAVTRAALNAGIEVYGIRDGYCGMHQDHIEQFDRKSVASIINQGGTILGSSRFPQFKDPQVRAEAVANLKKREIDALVVIGGDGSYTGARLLAVEHNIACVGIPGTIDNDIPGTDFTIGFHTALNTVVEAIDKLRDTSLSHSRISVVEVMGRHCGDLAVNAAIATGADLVIVPEIKWDQEMILNSIKSSVIKNNKRNAIVIVTELLLDSAEMAKQIEDETGVETRATVLGHIQRGGCPLAQDRILAGQLGVFAVEQLLAGKSKICCGIKGGKLVATDIVQALTLDKNQFNLDLLAVQQEII